MSVELLEKYQYLKMTELQMNLQTQENAYRYALKELYRLEKFVQKTIIPINNNRYHIVTALDDENILLMFKTELFQSFGQEMRKRGYLDASGVGESINRNDLKKCAIHNVKRIFRIDKEGRLYIIPLAFFNEHACEWTNKEGKIVKSISIHDWNRYNPR